MDAPDTPPPIQSHIQPRIQWYPGHIAKMEKQLAGHLKQVDVVVLVIDARLPHASRNLRLEKTIAHKPTLLLLNKTDLAEPKQTERWSRYFKQHYPAVMPYQALSHQQQASLVKRLLMLGEPCLKAWQAKGLKRRPLRIMVVGMPNVGKSSVINSLIGRKKAVTGHKAGVTRATQWIRIHEQLELMDTPGIIPPQLDDPVTGCLLAVVHSVGEAAFDEEGIATFLLERLADSHPQALTESYAGLSIEAPSLSDLATIRHLMLPGGVPDTKRAAQQFLKTFRDGKLGRITLEAPEGVDA